MLRDCESGSSSGSRSSRRTTRSILEKRHCRELNAFERQMRLKDERLESFRQQLLSMDTESSNMKSELEVLKRNMKSEMQELRSKMAMAMEAKSRAERAADGKDKELRALMKTMLQHGEGSPAADAFDLDTLSHYDAQQRVLILLQKELNDARRKLEEVEAEHQKHLLRAAEETEAELRQKDHQLAVAVPTANSDRQRETGDSEPDS